jgi:hypothetical protein
MPKRPPLCTPAQVGMMFEDGMSVDQISGSLKQSASLVRKYLKEWQSATPYDRNLARSGMRQTKGK